MVGRTSESQTKNKDIVIISYPNLSVAHFKGACVMSSETKTSVKQGCESHTGGPGCDSHTRFLSTRLHFQLIVVAFLKDKAAVFTSESAHAWAKRAHTHTHTHTHSRGSSEVTVFEVIQKSCINKTHSTSSCNLIYKGCMEIRKSFIMSVSRYTPNYI